MSVKYGERIRELRKNNKLTQAQLAQKLGKGESTIRMWELGKNEPDRISLIEMSRIFNCSIDYILGNDIDSAINDSFEIRAIQRASKHMSSTDRDKMLKLLQLTFEDAFDKE
ncbi:helix-turn-helix transcriptional regulator [Bacillus mycoides]|uniref:helix-turn-helix transcriptional regulator n=1 Tax=Bacillus mycoides TaxID=1405 RepID=UPI003F7B75B3